MSKKQAYRCVECGVLSSGWSGRCFACKSWHSVVSFSSDSRVCDKISNSVKLENITDPMTEEGSSRYIISITELDRILGGGIVPGSVVLVGGEPGIGKSTLMLQVAASMVEHGKSLYVSGEESSNQVKTRAKRINALKDGVGLLTSTSLEDILSTIKLSKNLKVVIIDSIQTLCSKESPSSAGTIAQVRFCAQELVNCAKSMSISMFILSHITKDGQIAGPKMLEHMVDTVLYFEGDIKHGYRLLRGVKNRFGASNEVGIFEMNNSGLHSVKDPSLLFMNEFSSGSAGSVIFAGLEGSRPLLMEIQTLVSKTTMATPRRAVVGWDINRLAMIIAVLSSRCNFFLHDKEVYLNVAGGFKINDPAVDLAVALSLISSLLNIPLKASTVVFGEIALSGVIKSVGRVEPRIKESSRMGFKNVILSESYTGENLGLKITKVSKVANLRKLFEEY